ncbi:MAG: hypothetical protein Q9166_006914 [cf. Caloplaca sp. 2 TL-2023]
MRYNPCSGTSKTHSGPFDTINLKVKPTWPNRPLVPTDEVPPEYVQLGEHHLPTLDQREPSTDTNEQPKTTPQRNEKRVNQWDRSSSFGAPEAFQGQAQWIAFDRVTGVLRLDVDLYTTSTWGNNERASNPALPPPARTASQGPAFAPATRTEIPDARQKDDVASQPYLIHTKRQFWPLGPLHHGDKVPGFLTKQIPERFQGHVVIYWSAPDPPTIDFRIPTTSAKNVAWYEGPDQQWIAFDSTNGEVRLDLRPFAQGQTGTWQEVGSGSGRGLARPQSSATIEGSREYQIVDPEPVGYTGAAPPQYGSSTVGRQGGNEESGSDPEPGGFVQSTSTDFGSQRPPNASQIIPAQIDPFQRQGLRADKEPFRAFFLAGIIPIDVDPDITWIHRDGFFRPYRWSTGQPDDSVYPNLVVSSSGPNALPNQQVDIGANSGHHHTFCPQSNQQQLGSHINRIYEPNPFNAVHYPTSTSSPVQMTEALLPGGNSSFTDFLGDQEFTPTESDFKNSLLLTGVQMQHLEPSDEGPPRGPPPSERQQIHQMSLGEVANRQPPPGLMAPGVVAIGPSIPGVPSPSPPQPEQSAIGRSRSNATYPGPLHSRPTSLRDGPSLKRPASFNSSTPDPTTYGQDTEQAYPKGSDIDSPQLENKRPRRMRGEANHRSDESIDDRFHGSSITDPTPLASQATTAEAATTGSHIMPPPPVPSTEASTCLSWCLQNREVHPFTGLPLLPPDEVRRQNIREFHENVTALQAAYGRATNRRALGGQGPGPRSGGPGAAPSEAGDTARVDDGPSHGGRGAAVDEPRQRIQENKSPRSGGGRAADRGRFSRGRDAPAGRSRGRGRPRINRERGD